MGFVSFDKLHKKCAPLFLRPDQQFFWGPELKTGLKELDDYYGTLPDVEKSKGVMSFAESPPKEGGFMVSKIWDAHFPGWRERQEVDLSDKNIKHDELLKYLKKFQDAPTLSKDEVDFDYSDVDSFSLRRMVKKRKGSWYQVPKDIEPDK